MRRSEQDAALQELYERVPEIPDCDGRCWISCGPVGMSDRELRRIRDAGYPVASFEQAKMKAETHWCEALTSGKRCAVYSLRPLVCRLWGAVESMKCPYGCVPEGGWLDDETGYALIAEAERIGGNRLPPPPPSRAALDAMRKVMEDGRGGIALRQQHNVPRAFRKEAVEFACPHCGFVLTKPDKDIRLGLCSNCRRMVPVPPSADG